MSLSLALRNNCYSFICPIRNLILNRYLVSLLATFDDKISPLFRCCYWYFIHVWLESKVATLPLSPLQQTQKINGLPHLPNAYNLSTIQTPSFCLHFVFLSSIFFLPLITFNCCFLILFKKGIPLVLINSISYSTWKCNKHEQSPNNPPPVYG